MRRTTPDLVGSRKKIYNYVSIGLMVLTIAYVLWTNYVVFVGGNLPLTSISLGQGSTGAGLTMLLIGDLVLVLALWFVVDGVLLNLLHMVLRKGNPSAASALPPQQQQQWQAQPGQPQWQQSGQPQQQWQQPGQPQQGWQQPGQWQQQGWPAAPPSANPPAPRDGGSQATLLAPRPDGSHDDAPEGYGVNDAAPVHRRWTPPRGE